MVCRGRNCLSYEPLFSNFSPALAEALAQIPLTADSCRSIEINLRILLAILFLISFFVHSFSLFSLCTPKQTPWRVSDIRLANCQHSVPVLPGCLPRREGHDDSRAIPHLCRVGRVAESLCQKNLQIPQSELGVGVKVLVHETTRDTGGRGRGERIPGCRVYGE